MKVCKNKIVTLRKEHGWSQSTLAEISGLGERTIQRIEKEGVCSLESAMALASVFELSPKELHVDVEVNQIDDEVVHTREVNWGGVIGMIVLFLSAFFIIDLTSKYPNWEMVSACLILGLSFTLSCVAHGIRETLSSLAATAWIIRLPTAVQGVSKKIAIIKSLRDYAYIVGIVSSLVCGLTIVNHSQIDLLHLTNYFTYAIRPLVYGILISELWFRPLKHRLEHILKVNAVPHKGESKS
ncbi:MAG: helix-turn-helix transcriptional regulator [Pseudoalteromonas sp.]